MARIIMHIDLNAFFVRCEEIKNPALEGKPVLIGHEGRSGIVSTASYAARKMGCHSGQPMFQATKCCPEAIIIAPDFHFYHLMSTAFYAFLTQYSRIIEMASVDECYVDMTKALKDVEDPETYLRNLQNKLFQETKLRCSIGIAPTKWLAKMASDMKKPMGLVFLRKRDIPTLVYPLPIESFWGIGKKTSPKLRAMGINTIADLAAFLKKEDQALHFFGKFYYEIKNWIEGTSNDVVYTEYDDPKSISASSTLMEDADNEASVAPMILSLAEEVSSRAKAQGLVGKTITLQVKEAEYDEKRNSFKLHNKSISSRDGTNEAEEIYEKCLALYRENFLGLPIRLVGVSLNKLINPKKETVQMSLWNYEQYEEMDKTKLLISELNRKMDSPMLLRASDIKKGKKHGK
ncbi:MAG: DNA polymerase IV [Bacilli bacterium]|nr:DNA polymerase IV [Bacilli bacterium]